MSTTTDQATSAMFTFKNKDRRCVEIFVNFVPANENTIHKTISLYVFHY